jgi:AmmeMemoRadiSam system protein A
MKDSHPLVQLARKTVESYVRDGRTIDPPQELTPEMQGRAGVFVSLHQKRGNQDILRGCIGTIEPSKANVALEVIHNAISAATRDPRFPPVRPNELDSLDIKVDVLTEPEPIRSPDELDPKRYGVIVRSGWRRGLLLPDLEGVDTVEYQVEIARNKAGIGSDEPFELYRFEVKRYT